MSDKDVDLFATDPDPNVQDPFANPPQVPLEDLMAEDYSSSIPSFEQQIPDQQSIVDPFGQSFGNIAPPVQNIAPPMQIIQQMPMQQMPMQQITMQQMPMSQMPMQQMSMQQMLMQQMPIPPPNIAMNQIPVQQMLLRPPFESTPPVEIPTEPYQDDDPIEIQSTPAQSTSTQETASEVNLTLTFGQEKLILKTDSPQEIPCIVSVSGYSGDLDEVESQRSGMDLVCVVDVSGSMRGQKLELVKKTLEFLLTKLTDRDRLSIVEFHSWAERLCRLTRCNQIGKQELERVIDGIHTNGTTEINEGLKLGLKVLADRRQTNQISSLLLLSDGGDNNSHTIQQRVHETYEENSAKIQTSYTVSTFGYGRDHDARIMGEIASAKDGELHYVEQESSIADCFAITLGGLMSLVADEIVVTLEAQETHMAFKIGKIYSDNIVEGNCFKMPQVFHGDHKDTVFILNFPEFAGVLEQEITITPIIAHCSYRLVKTEENRHVQAPLSFSVIEGPDFIVSNDDVYVHLCRVKTAEYMKAATAQGNGGDFPLARKTCDEGIAYLKDSLVSNHEIIKVLISDLEQAKDRFVDVQSWNSGGFAQVQMMQNCHYKQQSSTVSPMYQTPAQMNSVEAAQLFMKKG